MSVLVFDRIEAVIDTKFESGRLKPHLAKIFAKAGVLVPSTGTMEIAQVDKALNGLGIEQRMVIKSELAAAGVIS